MVMNGCLICYIQSHTSRIIKELLLLSFNPGFTTVCSIV